MSLQTNFNTTAKTKKYIPNFNTSKSKDDTRTITIVNAYNQPIENVTYSDGSSTNIFTSDQDGQITGAFQLNCVNGILKFPNTSDEIEFHTSTNTEFGIASMKIEYNNSTVANVPNNQAYISGYAIKNNFGPRALYKDGLNLSDSYQPVSYIYGYFSKNYIIDQFGYSTIKFQYNSDPSSVVNFKVKKKNKNSQTSINIVLTSGDPPFTNCD